MRIYFITCINTIFDCSIFINFCIIYANYIIAYVFCWLTGIWLVLHLTICCIMDWTTQHLGIHILILKLILIVLLLSIIGRRSSCYFWTLLWRFLDIFISTMCMISAKYIFINIRIYIIHRFSFYWFNFVIIISLVKTQNEKKLD